MSRIAIAVALVLPGCSEDGFRFSSEPRTCDVTASFVDGELSTPRGLFYSFGAATQRIAFGPAVDGTPYTVQLSDDLLRLDLTFDCGAAELAQYGIAPTASCPYAINGSVEAMGLGGGPSEFIDSSGGALIVDENVDCLAGRFVARFGESGELTGSFSLPWQ